MATNLDQMNRFGPRDPVFSIGFNRSEGKGLDHTSFGIYDNKDDAWLAAKVYAIPHDIVEYWNLNELLKDEESDKWREAEEAFGGPVITVQETV